MAATGSVVSIYNEQEGDVDYNPALLGSTVLLAEKHRPFVVWPCGYRTLTVCALWEIHMRDLLPLLVTYRLKHTTRSLMFD